MQSCALLLSSVALLAVAELPARSQCSEPFDAAVTRMGDSSGNLFDCPTSGNTGSAPCGITYRYYTDDPDGSGSVNAGVDGNPIYVSGGQGSYRSDVENSQNYYGGPHACGRPLYVLWDAQLDAGTGDHRGYYAAQAQLIEAGERGNIFANCGGTRSISCFDAADGSEAIAVERTLQGSLPVLGGLAPIPSP